MLISVFFEEPDLIDFEMTTHVLWMPRGRSSMLPKGAAAKSQEWQGVVALCTWVLVATQPGAGGSVGKICNGPAKSWISQSGMMAASS